MFSLSLIWGHLLYLGLGNSLLLITVELIIKTKPNYCINYITCLNCFVWNCLFLGKGGADSDTDDEADGDKIGGESVSQWVKEKTLKNVA